VTIRKNKLVLVAAVAAFLLPPSSDAFARNRGFNAVVQAVCATYHARQNYRFVSWLAGIATKVVRPEGVKSLRMAIFEDQDFTPRKSDVEFEEAVQKALQDNWSPIVRVTSRRDGERTSVYARQSGQDIRMVIITLEETEAVVMEVKMNARKFGEMMNDPENISVSLRDRSRVESARVLSDDASSQPPTLQRRYGSVAKNP
jgi:hypothetical protein